MFPYQWMFLILGLITILFGCSLWWFLPDSPLTATFLNDRERLIAVERLKSNQTGIKNSHHKAEQVKEAFTDLKVWILVWICFWQQMTNNLQTTFSGLVILGFGYSTYQAVLLSIPAQIIFAVVMIIASLFLSSRWGEGKRLFVMSLCYIPGIVSASILYSVPIKPSTRAAHLYAIFTLNIGSVAAGIGYTLLASNIAGYTKKTVAGAMFFSAYCVANIISPQTFLTSQAPRYAAGVGTTLASFAILEITLVALYFVYKRENAKRDKQNEEDGLDLTADEELINAFSDLTDLKNKRMRYKK
jgi:ACS family allantoate permease-like MFS transporter